MTVAKICTFDLAPIDERRFTELQNEGYEVLEHEEVIYKNLQGRYLKVYHPVNPCERILRLFACIISTPFACLVTAGTYGNYDAVDSCFYHCLNPALEGIKFDMFFIEDKKKTWELWSLDFQNLHFDSFSLENVKTLVEGENCMHIQSIKYPRHQYVFFKGPITKLTFIILIPNGETKDLIFCPTYTFEGKPCNEEQMKKHAEKLCAKYERHIQKIQSASQPLLGNNMNIQFRNASVYELSLKEKEKEKD